MGISIHELNVLRYVAKMQGLGAVATIGRMELFVTNDILKDIVQSKCAYGPFCEQLLLDVFGASKVESFDYSNYQNATYVADLNVPLDKFGEYDTIFDGGTLEHIYNVPQALKNLSQLCSDGGQIIHCLPANNECGHGFYQFSPELFYSLYSRENGYAETQVFIAPYYDETYWYEVKKPSNGERAIIRSIDPLYLLCRTKKISKFSHANVQQSDYVHVWGEVPVFGAGTSARSKKSCESRGRFCSRRYFSV